MKKWGRASLSSEDIALLKKFREHFRQQAADETTGEKLRRLAAVVDLTAVLSSEFDVRADCQAYLKALVECKLPAMLLVSGVGMVEIASSKGRYKEANAMLEEWVEAALINYPPEALIPFTTAQLQQGNSWIVAKLLERALAAGKIPDASRFEAMAARGLALNKLYRSLLERPRLKPGSALEQVELASRCVNERSLLDQSRNAVDEAIKTRNTLKAPLTHAQMLLSKELDELKN